MKIERKNTINTVPFEDVLAGIVFKDSNGAICMKFGKGYDFSNVSSSNVSPNAINLDTGSLYLYGEEEEVEILEDAVLIY